MKKNILAFLFMFIGSFSFAQNFDVRTFSNLVKSDKNEFIKLAESLGFTTNLDEASQTLFASKKGCVYGKPLTNKNNNEFYDLVLIVSTLDKENNKLILKNAKEDIDKKGVWIDNQYLYREWDMENPNTKEMWYKVLVYKKKK